MPRRVAIARAQARARNIALGLFSAKGQFSPLSSVSSSTLALWLDATRISGVDADPVTTWPDLSGNARDFTQATAAKKPTLQVSEINNKPVVRFDGTDDLLVNATAFLTGASGTVLAVLRFTALSDYPCIIGSFDGASDNRMLICRGRYDVTANNISFTQQNADTADAYSGSTALAADTPYQMMWASSGSAYSARVNRTAQTLSFIAGSDTGHWVDQSASQDLVSIGAAKFGVAGELQHFNGDLAELLVYEPAVSSADLTALEAYLAAKWGTP